MVLVLGGNDACAVESLKVENPYPTMASLLVHRNYQTKQALPFQRNSFSYDYCCLYFIRPPFLAFLICILPLFKKKYIYPVSFFMCLLLFYDSPSALAGKVLMNKITVI